MSEEPIEIDVDLRRGTFSLDVTATLPGEGTTVVLGASGTGKTTLMRAVAGLDRHAGRVVVRGRTLQDRAGVFLAPERRRIGYVSQEAALLPHLTALGNLEYAERRHRTGTRTLGAVVAALGLEALLHRRARDLSGGERQRVALGRALLCAPTLLLLDEPLASLDVAARVEVMDYLERMLGELSVPALYVTHSVDEGVRFADHMLWLKDGAVQARGSAGAVLGRMDVGASLGHEASGVIKARVARHDDGDGVTEVDSAWGRLIVHRLTAVPGTAVRMRIRARDVSLALAPEGPSSILNVLPARVVAVQDVGSSEALVGLASRDDAEERLLALVMRRSAHELGLTAGTHLYARVKAVTVR